MLRIKNTRCEFVIGKFDVSLFGNFTSVFFPVVLITFTLFNFFEVYDRILEKLNLTKFEFAATTALTSIEEGKKILYRGQR